MTDRASLRYYRAVNEAHEECVAYDLGGRGFFAEVTTVARAMIYAWAHARQLVLDSSDFAYRFRDGWTDYFRPFCRDVSEVAHERIRERFHFTTEGDRSHFHKLRSFAPERLRFGALEIAGMQSLLRHFLRLVLRLGDESQREVDRLRKSLDLPRNYVAVHIRRGDKIGDEDTFYPVEVYFEKLGKLRNETIFVLSDDHRTVVEVREYLESRRLANPVATLCRPMHTGFSVRKLRAGESFAGGDGRFDEEEAYRRYAFEETNRLLAETLIAAGASRFVSTFRSNVGKTVCFLRDDSETCRLLR